MPKTKQDDNLTSQPAANLAALSNFRIIIDDNTIIILGTKV